MPWATRHHSVVLELQRMTEPSPLVKGTADLRLPFAPKDVGHLPRGNITIDYVGHGAVTSRLLDVDPEWNWEPLSFQDDGQPMFQTDNQGNPVGLWIRLTVLGVTRLGFGNCNGNQFDAEKVLIGDAIRNAAMRFGVALDLWIKGHGEDDEQVAAGDTRQRPARGKPSTIADLCALCEQPTRDGRALVKGETGMVHKDCLETDEAAAANATPVSEPLPLDGEKAK